MSKKSWLSLYQVTFTLLRIACTSQNVDFFSLHGNLYKFNHYPILFYFQFCFIWNWRKMHENLLTLVFTSKKSTSIQLQNNRIRTKTKKIFRNKLIFPAVFHFFDVICGKQNKWNWINACAVFYSIAILNCLKNEFD